MSSLRRDLVERKLWMVVALLVVAVAAVPVFLLKGASANTTPTVPAPPAAPATTQTSTTQTGNSKEPAKIALARIARNPFASGVPKLRIKPAPQSSSTSSSGSTTSSTSTASSAAPGSSSPTSTVSMVSPAPATGSSSSNTSSGSTGSTGSTGSGGATTTSTAPTSTIASAPPSTHAGAPKKVRSWTIYSVSIRFGRNKAPVRHNIARLTALPSAGSPQVMFFGVMSGGRQAVFGLGAGVAHAGPGLCRPSRTSCSAIVLSAGQGEEVAWPTASGGMAQAILQVDKITSTITHSRAEALKAYKRVSRSGICDLSLAQPVSYDPDTGTVQSFPKDACKAQATSAPFAFFKRTP
jgi:hypothetical protein